MNVDEVLAFFENVYPGKNVSMLPENEPTEIICEIEPSSEHPEYSVAVASICKSNPHFHRLSAETYLVLEGKLNLHVNNKVLHLNKGDSCTVQPHEIHWAEGNFTLTQVTSRPGWIPEDHIIVRS